MIALVCVHLRGGWCGGGDAVVDLWGGGGVSADAGVVCGSICGSRGGSVRDVVHGQRVGGWMLGCRVLTRRVAVV